ncbi:hypothetical protein M1247_31115 [Mycobacterium sp. 21AC1]|uniref:hypothetical protein n=1 Tax=[Mycobacterium] appelbergii TaxID=2939269 RepID=UPI0029394986|nr:hypothetical protein [Mycobacterium sp. 21AC1]MDV3129392.1 hypothetical protein [Mycobacterium sp. 21AC1]
MLPSRSRLITWNPDSLSTAAASISSAGASVYGAVRNLDDGVNRLDETRTWSGKAHDAAAAMFGRATDRSSRFKDYTEAVARALNGGSGSIGRARTALLNKADEIDQGELNVTDQWVVLIDPAGMSAEKAADLQRAAEAAQGEINRLLTAVGEADQETAQNLLLARTGSDTGGAFNDVQVPGPRVIPASPADEVPDPSTDDGRKLQEVTRAGDMATTVRDISETEDVKGNKVTTFTMLDGGKQVITEYTESLPSAMLYPEGTVEVEQIDKNGNYVSESLTIPREDGTKFTEIWYAGGTKVTISEGADGHCSGGVITADGRHGVLPDEFFTNPIPTAAGATFSGLEKQADRGIPKLSAEALEDVRVGSKFGGPAIGIATALYDLTSAENLHDACVATFSGAAGVAGSLVGGPMGAAAVSAMGLPMLAPVGAFFGDAVGGLAFGYVGGIVGNIVCPP